MKLKTLTSIAILTCLALVIFVVEAQIPPLLIPGIKPGLSNVVTLVAIVYLGKREAFIILTLRILLGSLLAGTFISFMFSLTGGYLAFFLMIILIRFFDKKQLWVVSVFGAIVHNLGQLLVACVVVGNASVFYYTPVLMITAIITGSFTGVAAQTTLEIMRKIK